MHKGQSIYATDDQNYPGADGEDDDEETESSDEEAFVILENGDQNPLTLVREFGMARNWLKAGNAMLVLIIMLIILTKANLYLNILLSKDKLSLEII